MTAKELYKLLIDSGIKNGSGSINFNFLNSTIIVKEKSSIGYVFQEWLEKWMDSKNIKYSKNPNSQDWPDFYLDKDGDNINGLVEVKTFDFSKSPNFDIANFYAYVRSLRTRAYRLDADYLIFGYKMDNNGVITIGDIWLKKIWDITSSSGPLPIKCQEKQKMIVNIRPAKWYSNNIKHEVFGTKENFIKAINQTVLSRPESGIDFSDWMKEVKADYKRHTNRDF